MAGFGKVAFVGEYFNQKIVNVFHFRSTEWLPDQGNPFDDTLAFVDAVIGHYKSAFLATMSSDYTLRTVEGVGYSSSYGIVTSSPLVRTVGEVGGLTGVATVGASLTSIIGLRCGEQVQVNGTGHSPRNRGYVCIGPLAEKNVDNYSHLTAPLVANLNTLAAKFDDGITVVLPAVTLTPIRIHEKWIGLMGNRVLVYRTYSDIRGYRINPVASFRRSRLPEA
jgi:hypothetical protein